MDLQEFITQTLLQVVRGVSDANDAIYSDLPEGETPPTPKLFVLPPGVKQDEGSGVFFDVAITTRSDVEKGGGGKARLHVVQLDVGGKQVTSAEQVSRISFAVQIGHYHS